MKIKQKCVTAHRARKAKKPSVKAAAEELAACHAKIDDYRCLYYRLPHSSEIRLVEVSDFVADDCTGTTQVFRWNSSDLTPYPVALVILSPEEWSSVQQNKLKLPKGWNRDKLVRIDPCKAGEANKT